MKVLRFTARLDGLSLEERHLGNQRLMAASREISCSVQFALPALLSLADPVGLSFAAPTCRHAHKQSPQHP